ncbi:MAG: 3-oxoacyl-[acyl-carrier-protein] synthase [Chthoniobacter sp.]|jgi:3-oxoacyl-[acyl-carrier-protein] synthase-3|nr:3-oxoacyl-[acyl-carrier-protein] synthase [Chthoniobacter sp.]
MLGICNIGVYIPKDRVSNYERKEQFGIDDAFIETKIGVRYRSVKGPGESTADLCLRALEDLEQRYALNRAAVDCVTVVTQNPGARIPHVSAILHGELGLPESCAAFDISLGCSGYVYGLATVQAFMRENGLRTGLMFTADPYSNILDPEDKNTSLLFGDAATVTLISSEPAYLTTAFTFGTLGREHRELTCGDKTLYFNGRAIFNFAARYIPPDITRLLEKAGLRLADVDRFVFHQGSKYLLDTLTKLLKLDPAKVAYDIADYGNTVSSSIPIILAKELDARAGTLVISGFGAGLSWASAILKKT